MSTRKESIRQSLKVQESPILIIFREYFAKHKGVLIKFHGQIKKTYFKLIFTRKYLQSCLQVVPDELGDVRVALGKVFSLQLE